MKLEIELDLNKIDYDAINKQIQEKVTALDINDCDITSKINRQIEAKVKDQIEYAYNNYLDKYWGSGANKEGRNLIESTSKAEITNRTKQIVDEAFEKLYSEDELREIMFKIIPDVFTAVVFSKMEYSLFSKEQNYYANINSMVRSEIDSRLRSY